MRNKKIEKLDKKFLIVIAVLVGAGILLSPLLSLTDKPRQKELPGEMDSKISKLVINELMSNNGGVFASENGSVCDYLELFNGSDRDLDLSGYGLSDSNTTVKWAFPEGTEIKAGSYLVVALTGENDAGLNASFKLSSGGGEEVILVNSKKKIIDAVKTVAMTRGQAMVRDENGGWFVTNYGTPGFENSLEGQAAYAASLISDEVPELVLSEALVRNAGNYINHYGEMEGYIEVQNVSDHPVKLSEYTLSNSIESPFRFSMEDVELDPGEFYVCYTVNAYSGRTDCTGFSLNSKNGEVVLGHKGKVLQIADYAGLANGKALARMSDGNLYPIAAISPGYPNNAEGIREFQRKSCSMPKGLVISEAMNSNSEFMAQNGGKYYDWVELFNNSGRSVSLSEYFLSTSTSNLSMFRLPEITLEAGQYCVIMCSGDEALTNKSYYHANFKLSESETLLLIKDSVIQDCMFVADVPAGYSYGRTAEGFAYFSTPTPKAANGEGTTYVSSVPEVSIGGGVFNDVTGVSVEIKGGGQVYYTTNGSDPTKDSKVYSGPIELSATTVLKCRNYDEGGRGSDIVVNSYIINEKHTVPVISLSLNPDDFSYLNNHAWTVGLEKKANVEFFEGDTGFNERCGLSLFGGNARGQSQKSYCVKFGSKWGGSPELSYPLFDSVDSSSYKKFLLRSGSTAQVESIFKDELGTSIVVDYTQVDAQDYKVCVVYVNGKYWGLYNIREKVDEDFVANHYNVDPDTVDIFRIDGNVTSGSMSSFNKLKAYCRTHDLSKKEYYDYVCSKINVEALADFWISEGYVTNNDLMNVRYFRSPEYDDGRFHPIFYDLDYAWHNINVNWYTVYMTSPEMGLEGAYKWENDIIKALFKNKEFRELWLTRMGVLMNTAWSKENLTNRLNELVAAYEPEIKRSQKRWYRSVQQWEDGVDVLYNWIAKREKYYLQSTKSFFKLSDAEMKEYFGDLWKS